MTSLLSHSQVKPLLSDEHFSVDGTLIEVWASQKSFRPKDGSGDDGANFSSACPPYTRTWRMAPAFGTIKQHRSDPRQG
jgi:hypothetical protein